jgi:uncharacterized protein YqgC (DUF456 family)
LVLAIEITLLVLALLVGWGLTLFALPGTWVMVGAAVIYALLAPATGAAAIGWQAMVALVVLAALGELIETAAGAVGAQRAGASRRSVVLAIVGSIAGAMIGAGVGSPLPVIGTIVGAVLGAGIGAFGGALLGETWKGRSLDHSWRVGEAAFKGRLLGTAGKLAVATAMVLVGIAALFF